MPIETARFYFPWGVFGAKQTACTVILLKVNTFLPTPSPLSTEEVFCYIRCYHTVIFDTDMQSLTGLQHYTPLVLGISPGSGGSSNSAIARR